MRAAHLRPGHGGVRVDPVPTGVFAIETDQLFRLRTRLIRSDVPSRIRPFALFLSKTSKHLSVWGLFLFHNSRPCSFLSRHSSQICLRSSIRALRSSWRTWLCATKSACFSDPRENDPN